MSNFASILRGLLHFVVQTQECNSFGIVRFVRSELCRCYSIAMLFTLDTIMIYICVNLVLFLWLLCGIRCHHVYRLAALTVSQVSWGRPSRVAGGGVPVTSSLQGAALAMKPNWELKVCPFPKNAGRVLRRVWSGLPRCMEMSSNVSFGHIDAWS